MGNSEHCRSCPRLRALEKRMDKLEGKRKRIGFVDTDVHGRPIAAHDEDREDTEFIEVRKK